MRPEQFHRRVKPCFSHLGVNLDFSHDHITTWSHYNGRNTLDCARREVSMLRIFRLSGLYFTIVFGAGFILGPIRVLLLEPHLGTRKMEKAGGLRSRL